MTGCKPTCGPWESNLIPLQEHQVLLTATDRAQSAPLNTWKTRGSGRWAWSWQEKGDKQTGHKGVLYLDVFFSKQTPGF